MDIGGSHLAAACFSTNTSVTPLEHLPLDAGAGALEIIRTICSVIRNQLRGEAVPLAVGIAMPGPFNYDAGISEIFGVGGKFAGTFGLHVGEAIHDYAQLPAGSEVYFSNDAHCFAIGAYHTLHAKSKRTICLTLGTGFGSAFLENGLLLPKNKWLTGSGYLYNQPFHHSIADDYFSTRWFLKEYFHTCGRKIESVKALAELAADDDCARRVFRQFGTNLAAFLQPWMAKFECDTIIMGGNIVKARHLFGEDFTQTLRQFKRDMPEIITVADTEACIIAGAALLAEQNMNRKMESAKMKTGNTEIAAWRKTTQPLLPLQKTNDPTGGYDIFPSFSLAPGIIHTGFETLAATIAKNKTVVIDGFGGVLWDTFRQQLNACFPALGVKPLWYDISTCLKPESDIEEMISPNLNGNDPVFGKRYRGELADFFDAAKLGSIKPDPHAEICIVYGTGAALSKWDGLLVYIDIPKNEIQYRMRAKTICNLGATGSFENTQMYKRFYFVDWPVLNRHKQQLLAAINIVADEQRMQEIAWMQGNDFRKALDEMLHQPFRARPWFEAGVWGGQWMKRHLKGLNPGEINYAWSFELITPENGITFESDRQLLEVSFDFLLYHNNEQLLGKAAKRFGTEFPIRFDFLDTYDGGNLSIQCHPRTKYIQEQFGESFTQDETYYILDCEPGAEVYLGFQDNIEPQAFKQALLHAQKTGEQMDATSYVQSFDAHRHDLFLIPNGTIHASGKNNLVLEISSTPYIFTFKMYDWQRMDLAGKPRPINIEHAFHNLYFDRKGKWVEEHLISKPVLLEEKSNFKHYLLPTHPEHFYAVERFEFNGEISIETKRRCLVCMLVQGNAVDVLANEKMQRFHYAETFVIPAAAETTTVRNVSDKDAMMVIAYVKDACC